MKQLSSLQCYWNTCYGR